MINDTIAAVATPQGEGAIGIVRLSGDGVRQILDAVFKPTRARPMRDWQLRHGRVIDPRTGAQIDEALAVLMPGPHSYTAEDTAEIQCHAGMVVIQQVMAAVLAAGARVANPGEFTLRAFLNGRIDLSQAESVVDVIRARSSKGLDVALRGLRGDLSDAVIALRNRAIQSLAYLTALTDFVEDEIPEQEVIAPLRSLESDLDKLIRTGDLGRIARQGVRVVIAGSPNVGKSSLLNALLRAERAIVTPVPGTTRDTLEETVTVGGLQLVLVDTAGLSETDDLVEKLGVQRSRDALRQADVVLVVLDASRPLEDGDAELLAGFLGKPMVVALNKSDLLSCLPEDSVQAIVGDGRVVSTSALAGDGLDDLRKAILDVVVGDQVVPSEEVVVGNPRHLDALNRAQVHLREVIAGLERGDSVDLLCVGLSASANCLGEITGETLSVDLLDTVFSTFCVGK